MSELGCLATLEPLAFTLPFALPLVALVCFGDIEGVGLALDKFRVGKLSGVRFPAGERESVNE